MANIGTWAQQMAQPWLLLSLGASPFLLGLDAFALGVLVKDVFYGGAGQFSIALGAFGVGGLLGASGLLALDPKRDQRFISSAFAINYSVIVMLAALNPLAWVLPVLLMFAGVAMTVSNASANGLLQSQAPERIRGQSVSMFMLAMRGGMAVGSLLTGLSVHLLGVREALLINGVVALLAQLLIRRNWLKAP